jgi:predicted RNA binding protein YcfA (HicA-like mRNA interferase family)
MGQRRFPPLTPDEVQAILRARGFEKKRQDGSHAQWERLPDGRRTRSIVTVDVSRSEFCEDLMKSMIRQSNLTREEFYSATKRTARKANVGFSETLEVGAQ